MAEQSPLDFPRVQVPDIHKVVYKIMTLRLKLRIPSDPLTRKLLMPAPASGSLQNEVIMQYLELT